MRVVPIVENSKKDGFTHEKALSIYIESGDKKIIFDTGKSTGFIKNGEKLGIDFSSIDYYIISHGHRDHFGGIWNLDISEKSKVYASRYIEDDYHFGLIFKKSIGKMKNSNIKIAKVEKNFEICENIFLLTNKKVKRNWFFFKNMKKDDFSHEIHLVIVEEKKLNIFTGCCHCGIDNLLENVRENFSSREINSLIGGIHTRSYILFPIKIFQLIKTFKRYKIQKLYLGHCSGNLVIKICNFFMKNIEKLVIGKDINI